MSSNWLTIASQLYAGPARDHTVLGTVVVSCMGIQPILGYLHHLHYLEHQSRGVVSYIHIWWGRSLMVLGVVNGGLGLQLAAAGNNFVIAYSVVAGVIFLLYVGIKALKTLADTDSQPSSKYEALPLVNIH